MKDIEMIICDKCEGTGDLPISNDVLKKLNPSSKFLMVVCDKCYGDGKLDWVENIVGKKYKDIVVDMDVATLYPEVLKFDVLVRKKD